MSRRGLRRREISLFDIRKVLCFLRRCWCDCMVGMGGMDGVLYGCEVLNGTEICLAQWDVFKRLKLDALQRNMLYLSFGWAYERRDQTG